MPLPNHLETTPGPGAPFWKGFSKGTKTPWHLSSWFGHSLLQFPVASFPVSSKALRASPGPLVVLPQLLLEALRDGRWVGMRTFAKAITSHSIPRLREARPCSHSISPEPSRAQGGEEQRLDHSALDHSWTSRDLCGGKKRKENSINLARRGWDRGGIQMSKPGERLNLFP